jgi:hypothetical protein
MRMRQSIAQLERAFVEEVELDRVRRDHLSLTAAQRSRVRTIQRRRARSSLRFALLVFSMIATAVIVTVAMFRTLYIVLG